MKKRRIFSISLSILIVILGQIVLRQEITNRIQKKVIENTQSVNDSLVIKREIRRLDRAIKLNPRKYLYYATRADLHCRIKKYTEAIQDLEKIYDIKDDYAEGYLLEGMIYDWIGSTDSAMIAYKKAEELYNLRLIKETDPDLVTAHKVNLITLKLLQNDSVGFKSENDSIKQTFDVMHMIMGQNKDEILNQIFNR